MTTTQTTQTPVSSGQSDEQRFSAFVAHKSFPCVGAKSALNRDRLRFAKYGDLGGADAPVDLLACLQAFAAEFPEPGTVPVSFVAMFDDDQLSEAAFEAALWRQLQSLHALDAVQGNAWDASVSSDTRSTDFSFSLGGRAFFVVGLHPNASRLSRRAPAPCLVFNFHDQFQALKVTGKYQSMQTAIRSRDILLQGSVNPVLARFGEASEARQYAGRDVGSAWKCPFHLKAPAHA